MPTLSEAVALAPLHRGTRGRARAAKAEARASMIRDAAMTYGVRAGYAARAEQIKQRIASRSEQLDNVYVFGPLLIGGRMLPPVIESVQRVQALSDSASEMRETSRVFRVVRAARLVTTPPTWRMWLTIAPKPVQRPDDSALPRTRAERDVWEDAVRKAWDVGAAQAEAVARSQIERLTYDYTGMLRYRRLVAEGIINPAEVSHTGTGVVVSNDVLRVEDRLYAVSRQARFQATKHWKAKSAVITKELGVPGGAKQ